MARPIINVPASLCRMTAFDWDIDWRTMPRGEATSGDDGVLSVGFPRWVGNLSLVLPQDLILQWRAVRAKARGRLGLYRITMFDPLVPVPTDGQPWSNGDPWSNGEPWEGVPFWTVTAAASRGATEINVAIPDPMPVPVIGQIVSHEDWPTIIVQAIEEDDATWTLTLARPLMVDAAVSDRIDLRPVGIFEAVSDETGNPSYDVSRVSRPTLELREYLNR